MILLFNLNSYIGGGETLLIRQAVYFQLRGINYQILSYRENSWITREAKRLKLNVQVWPGDDDSVVYQTHSDSRKTLDGLSRLFHLEHKLNIFTFCYRDLYNALFYFPKIAGLTSRFVHGIYHPEDVFYLKSCAMRPSIYINFNRELAKSLLAKDSIVFVNLNCANVTLGLKSSSSLVALPSNGFIPLPINLLDRIPARKDLPKVPGKVNLICISRFVSFKIAAVLEIVKFALSNHQYFNLTVIGHGPWGFLLTSTIKLYRAKNVKIVSGVGPDRLSEHILDAHIGYAQGTSILEIAKFGVPVVVAPYSRLRELVTGKYETVGIFGEIPEFFTFGDFYIQKGIKTIGISQSVGRIVEDYAGYQDRTLSFVQQFAAEKVCGQIYQRIISAGYEQTDSQFMPPRAPILKRLLRPLIKYCERH